VSLVRVLGRSKGGEDPNVPFDAIADGYRGIRRSRKECFNDISTSNGTVDGCVLMGFDQATKQSIEVVHFENGTIITSPKASKLFEEISFNTKEAIEQTITNTGKLKLQMNL